MMPNSSSFSRIGRGLALGTMAGALWGCASKPLNVPYNPANFGAPDPVLVAKLPDVISPGDKIRISVFQVDALSGEFQVQANGAVDYPLIGLVQAQGYTPAEFAKILADRLGEKNLRHPDVQVAVLQPAPTTITIEGAVKQPAVVQIRGPTSLLQAIAMAGGTTEQADNSQVIVFRNVGGKKMAAAFDLRAIRRAEATDPVIYPNDMVVVSDSNNKKLIDSILRAVPALGIFGPL